METIDPEVEKELGDSGMSQTQFFKWVLSLLIVVVLLISAPFTVGPSVAAVTLWATGVSQLVSRVLALHPILVAVGGAVSAFFFAVVIAYQAVGPSFKHAWVRSALLGILLGSWMLFWANMPNFDLLTLAFLAAGGTPPWLSEMAASLLVIVEVLPMIIAPLAVTVAYFWGLF